ncbi:hypothetical protein [Microbacterium caowuchunii]|uniref:Uncharacterized protein n=1 Tax=Microbacterium caowuchunii TaxID=2614638 RepID=A0A5N0TLZ8_9MICO|nr:hypothetical protein [Microbacterium caowuchunii]KAA9135187.1 hypothetical protein F6B40_05820 [Microbacterium caowuchunii]
MVALARDARRRRLEILGLPANYYDELAARLDLPTEELSLLRELDLAYDRDADGEYLHFYRRTVLQAHRRRDLLRVRGTPGGVRGVRRGDGAGAPDRPGGGRTDW